jgi:hypothetical protein
MIIFITKFLSIPPSTDLSRRFVMQEKNLKTTGNYLLGPELLTKAMCLLSGDHELTLMVPCPPYR